MFAIFETGGKQYKVQQGDTIYVEKLDVDEKKEIKFENILMIDNKVGQPYLKGASVVAIVDKHGKRKKIRVIKFKSKKHYYKRKGHRQLYTKLTIKQINS